MSRFRSKRKQKKIKIQDRLYSTPLDEYKIYIPENHHWKIFEFELAGFSWSGGDCSLTRSF